MDSKLIAKISQISCCLEVSGYPKPGNVHRNRDYADMVFEDFLISGVVIGDTICDVAINASYNEPNDARLGFYILKAIKETNRWVSNNTNLGIMMLFVPLAAAAAISDEFSEIRDNVVKLMKNTTVQDAVNLYDAIDLADAGGMGEQKDYDVKNKEAKKQLKENKQTMFDVLEISSSWDTIAHELTTDMPICFETGFPAYKELKVEQSLNMAAVLTFLKILSQNPDTLISRKYGQKKAEEVSRQAFTLLSFKKDKDFKSKLQEFDDYLFKNKLNPGTTADLTAASIMLTLLHEKFE